MTTTTTPGKLTAFKRTVRRFLDEHVSPHIDAWEEAGGFPAVELFRQFGKHRLLGIDFERRWGGLALGFAFQRTLVEELGALDCGGIGMSMTSHSDMCLPAIASHGGDEAKERYLRPAIAGEAIGAIALTEPEGGSDYGSLTTTLRRKPGRGLRLDGSKSYITNGTVASFYVVLCRSAESADVTEALTMIVVPADAPGVTTSPYRDKLGNRCCDHGSITFDDCHVADEDVLGGIGLGYGIQAEQFLRERLVSGIIGTAQARRLLELATAYARGRAAFGKTVIEHQAISNAMVDLDTRITLLEALLDKCAAAMDGDATNLGKYSLIAKLHGASAWQAAADLLMRVQAGRGYLVDRSVQRAYRDARSATIAGGTDETLRRNLAGYLT